MGILDSPLTTSDKSIQHTNIVGHIQHTIGDGKMDGFIYTEEERKIQG
jgi:hypothetical protein